MVAVLRAVALAGVVAFTAGCRPSGPTTGPTPPTPSPAAPPAPQPPTIEVPPLEGPSSLDVFGGTLIHPVREYTRHSQFVVYDTGGFTLHYTTVPGTPYVGAYRRENNQIVFTFASSGQWTAIGTVVGDSMEVRFNEIMQLTDFEDAIYVRSP